VFVRLDKALADCGAGTRKELRAAIRQGEVTRAGVPLLCPETRVNPLTDTVCFRGEMMRLTPMVYIMLHKPPGVLSATADVRGRTVLDLLPQSLRGRGLFPAGRLDKDATGFLLLTNDGPLAHRLLTPRGHVEKVYRATLEQPLTIADIAAFTAGVYLAAEDDRPAVQTKPATLEILTPTVGRVTLAQGIYHQVKRMFAAQGNRVVALHREKFAGLALDAHLAPGDWRFLTPQELEKILTLKTEEKS
jgi:16S rRNA pseudouridine516 synthase